MNNNRILVEERSRDIGGFLVGRLLPFRKKRQVGPFTFIDHMGPTIVRANAPINVDQHPHTGLSTLTYLLEGEIEHKDSTGAHQIIKPGDVGFMTSGKGATHTERTPTHLSGVDYQMHGYQIWVALPINLEECLPSFQYIQAEDLPTKTEEGLTIKVVSGTGFGMTSPLKVYSNQFMVDLSTSTEHKLCVKDKLKGEIAVVIVNGEVIANETKLTEGQMLISKTDDECDITLSKNSRVLLFGGKPFPEERFLMWNFVSHSKDRLKEAKQE